MNEKPNFLWQVLTGINTWITVADAKALGLLAANGVLAGIVLENFEKIFPEAPARSCFFMLIALAAFISLLASIFFTFRCVLPRLSAHSSRFPVQASNPPSLLYFKHIADIPEADYIMKIQEMMTSESNIIEQVSGQIWANSRVAKQKHHDITVGFWALAVSIFFGAIGLIVTL